MYCLWLPWLIIYLSSPQHNSVFPLLSCSFFLFHNVQYMNWERSVSLINCARCCLLAIMLFRDNSCSLYCKMFFDYKWKGKVPFEHVKIFVAYSCDCPSCCCCLEVRLSLHLNALLVFVTWCTWLEMYPWVNTTMSTSVKIHSYSFFDEISSVLISKASSRCIITEVGRVSSNNGQKKLI